MKPHANYCTIKLPGCVENVVYILDVCERYVTDRIVDGVVMMLDAVEVIRDTTLELIGTVVFVGVFDDDVDVYTKSEFVEGNAIYIFCSLRV